jgi:hypothetical protein
LNQIYGLHRPRLTKESVLGALDHSTVVYSAYFGVPQRLIKISFMEGLSQPNGGTSYLPHTSVFDDFPRLKATRHPCLRLCARTGQRFRVAKR